MEIPEFAVSFTAEYYGDHWKVYTHTRSHAAPKRSGSTQIDLPDWTDAELHLQDKIDTAMKYFVSWRNQRQQGRLL